MRYLTQHEGKPQKGLYAWPRSSKPNNKHKIAKNGIPWSSRASLNPNFKTAIPVFQQAVANGGRIDHTDCFERRNLSDQPPLRNANVFHVPECNFHDPPAQLRQKHCSAAEQLLASYFAAPLKQNTDFSELFSATNICDTYATTLLLLVKAMLSADTPLSGGLKNHN